MSMFYVDANRFGYDMISSHFQIGSTVNSEIFARTLFSRNFAYAAKFRENKTLAKWQNYSVVY